MWEGLNHWWCQYNQWFCIHINTADPAVHTDMDRPKATATSSVREDQEKSNKAVKEVSVETPALLRRMSRPAHSQAQGMRLFSLKGLLTAHKFSKGLRERAALKHAARKGPGRKPTAIIHEQVPAGSAQPTERFPCAPVSRMLQAFSSSRLDGLRYSALCSGTLVMALSEEVRGLVRTVCPARYRLVCTVALGQRGPEGQQADGGMLLASRCLWDPHTDSCVSHTYQNHEMFCTIVVFAVYCE